MCCAPYHLGKPAPTAEALMRSRYVAYILHKGRYLYNTWHPEQRPSKASLKKFDDTQWLALEIIRCEAGGLFDQQGIVEFKAHSKQDNAEHTLHEISRFIKQGQAWLYVDGTIL